MLCLGIESSCDETALAVVRDGVLLDAVLASQADIHALFGGVVPELASREHYRYLGTLFDQLMQRLDLRPSDLDVVAVSRGPGLLGSLLVGVAFAKALALGCGARFLGVNHLHAHLLAAGLENELRFPALGLLVSGGHTHIYRMESPSRCIVLGKTLDDAALTLDGSTISPADGMLEWVDDAGNVLPGSTRVKANTAYKWRFTPTDTNYKALTGSIELWHKSTSSGGYYYAPPAEQPIEAPKTADPGVALYAALSLLSLTGLTCATKKR